MDRWLRSSALSPAATAILLVAAIYFARSVLAPLAIAVLLSVVLSGAVTRVERWGVGGFRIGRIAAVLVVALGISLAFGAIGWILASQGSDLAEELPAYQRTFQEKVREPIGGATRLLRQIRSVAPSSPAAPASLELVPRDAALVGMVASWLGSLAAFAATAGIVVVLLIFILIERESLRDRLLRVAGRSEMRATGSTLRETGERVAGYLRALTLLNAGHGIAVGAGLALLGLPGALLFGLLAGMLRFIPYAGPLIAAGAPLAMSVAAFDGWTMMLWVGAYLGTLELVSNNVFEPWLYGTRVGLSPFAVVLSAIFWSWLWGPIGLVLATPLTVSLVVLGRHVSGVETLSILLSDSPPLHAFERIYERLLAHDVDSATVLVADEARERPLVELWDTTLVPVLRLLERDRRLQALDGEDVELAREAFEIWMAESPDAPEPSRFRGRPVLCLPMSAFGDEILSAGLEALLEARGVAGSALARRPSAELVESVAREKDAIVCLSALDARTPAIRQRLRQLRGTTPTRPVVIGAWGRTATELVELRAAIGDDQFTELVGRVGEAIAVLCGEERPPVVEFPGVLVFEASPAEQAALDAHAETAAADEAHAERPAPGEAARRLVADGAV